MPALPPLQSRTLQELKRLFSYLPRRRLRTLLVLVPLSMMPGIIDLASIAVVARLMGTLVGHHLDDLIPGMRVFGLPPIEALACGCVVFSSLNHALADSLDPCVVGHQIGCGSLESDLERIAAAVTQPQAWQPPASRLTPLLEACSEPVLLERWRTALEAMDGHWDGWFALGVVPLRRRATWRIRLDQVLGRLRQRLGGRLPRWPAAG